MRCILGIELKNVLVSKGEEHDKVSAKIFMDNKKVGEIINDGWCEEYYIEFSNHKLGNEFEDRMKKYYKEKNIKGLEHEFFIKELLFISQKYKGVKDPNLKHEQLTFLWK